MYTLVSVCCLSLHKKAQTSVWLFCYAQCNFTLFFDHQVIAEGFEPSTVCLEGRCSIQLSYATEMRREDNTLLEKQDYIRFPINSPGQEESNS